MYLSKEQGDNNNMMMSKISWEELLYQGIKMWQLPEKDKPSKRVVGVISDLHVPYHNKKTTAFLVETFVRRGVTDIVFIGDLLDNYWYGHKYLKDYNVMGPKEDNELSKSILREFYKEFPVATFIIGNHDLRIIKREDDGFIDDFEEVFRRKFCPPTTWTIVTQVVIDGVLYCHGTGVSGQNGAVQMMRAKRMSTVIGHTHTFGGIIYSNNGIDNCFALNVGCLVDTEAPVFNYGLTNREKPVLGCGVVYSKYCAEFIPLIIKNKSKAKLVQRRTNKQ